MAYCELSHNCSKKKNQVTRRKFTEMTCKALNVTVPVSNVPSAFWITKENCINTELSSAGGGKPFRIFASKYVLRMHVTKVLQSKVIFVIFLGFSYAVWQISGSLHKAFPL